MGDTEKLNLIEILIKMLIIKLVKIQYRGWLYIEDHNLSARGVSRGNPS